MRNLFIIGMLLVGASMAGWFTIERDGDSTQIRIHRDEIRGDLSNVRERGREYLDRERDEDQQVWPEDRGYQADRYQRDAFYDTPDRSPRTY